MRLDGRLVGCMVHNERLYFWLNQRAGSPVKPENYEGIRLYWTPRDGYFRVPYGTLLPDDTHGEGTNLRFGKTPPPPETPIAKFPSLDELHILVAGGTAGRFSMAIPGWLGTKNGSRPLTRLIDLV